MPYISKTKKLCCTCGKEKSVSYFKNRGGVYKWRHKDDLTKYESDCKACARVPSYKELIDPDYKRPKLRSKTQIAYDRLKKEEKKARKKPAVTRKERIRRTRIRSMTYLAEKGCSYCPQRDPRVLQYDHKDPKNKFKSISTLISTGYGWSSEVLRREIRKCIVICANCHAIHTHKKQENYMDDQVQAAIAQLRERYAP